LAKDTDSSYVAWGHSMIVDQWGKVIDKATEKDMDLYIDLGKYIINYITCG